MEVLGTDVMLPQVAQGALGGRVPRVTMPPPATLLRRRSTMPLRQARVDAERAFLAAIGGACDLPVAGHATTSTPRACCSLEGLLAAPDGSVVVRRGATGPAGDGAAGWGARWPKWSWPAAGPAGDASARPAREPS